MSQFMTHLLYSSFSAAILIVAVLAIRLIVTKKAPRWVACVLWGMVGARLLIPYSIESEFSILPEIELSQDEETSLEASGESDDASFGESGAASVDDSSDGSYGTESFDRSETVSVPSQDDTSAEVTSEATDESEETSEETSEEASDVTSKEASEETSEAASEAVSEETSEESTVSVSVSGGESDVSDTPQGGGADWVGLVQTVWLCGAVLLALYAAVQYMLLRRRVAVFSVGENGIRRCEQIDTPFVLGFFRPRIYLPFGLTEEAETYIIAHEQAHIRRFDHVTKIIAFAALALHWFNPFVWLAFVLFCRDIEYACDEKVVRNLSGEERKAYASALLSASVRK